MLGQCHSNSFTVHASNPRWITECIESSNGRMANINVGSQGGAMVKINIGARYQCIREQLVI